MMFLGIAFPVLSGCTMAVLKLRKDHETKIAKAAQFQSIAEVRSGWINEDGTVFACTEFKNTGDRTPREMAIRASDAQLIGQTSISFNPPPPRGFATDDLPLYYYPLASAEKGCKPPANSTQLPIHSVQLPTEKWNRISEIISPPEFTYTGSPALFEIRFSADSSGGASDSISDVLLVFSPSLEASNPDPFGIPGGYEPGTEAVNPYTPLVAPAILVDAAITIPVILFLDSPVFRKLLQ